MHRVLFITLLITAFFAGSDAAAAQGACSGAELFTAAKCVGDDNSQVERELFELVNKYRAANGKPALRLSAALSMVANRRMLDIRHNVKKLTHSWSNCEYDIQREETWGCVIEAPARLKSGYMGRGMETLFRTTGSDAVPAAALEAWKKSTLHNSIILNLASFANTPWDEAGVAIEGQYAAVWFGSPASVRSVLPEGQLGLGTNYSEAAEMITSITGFAMGPTARPGQWTAASPDGKLVLVLSGNSTDARGASLLVTMQTAAGDNLDPNSLRIIQGLLNKIFPEWKDATEWLDKGVSEVSKTTNGMKAKAVRKLTAELKNTGKGGIVLSIRPLAPSVYREF